MESLPSYWPLIVLYGGLLLLGIGLVLAKPTQARIERRRIQTILEERDRVFRESFAKGRQWLADFIAEARAEIDKRREEQLRYKKHPARKFADVVKEIAHEKRELQAKAKFLEYQLRSYEEYFPFLEEYREVILDERAGLAANQDNIEQLESIDPVRLFLDQAEYEKLSSADRNQLALDRYIKRTKNNWEIGRLYERYIGYLYESKGWRVTYQGAIMGFEDFGRDLICLSDGRIEIVQAKCWSKHKVIREKHIFQLFGTVIHFRKSNPGNVFAVFVTTTDLSPEAKEVADALSIRVEQLPLKTDYPMVKCNLSRATGEKIYHLPFDQQYDKVVVGDRKGEQYVATAIEAEQLGFRRAWRYLGESEINTEKTIRTTKGSSVTRTSTRS
jgi:Restriction endonuclease